MAATAPGLYVGDRGGLATAATDVRVCVVTAVQHCRRPALIPGRPLIGGRLASAGGYGGGRFGVAGVLVVRGAAPFSRMP